MTILLAEDDSFLQKFYASTLEEAGYTIEIARDGIEALEKVKTLKPNLLLLDILMPKKDGFSVLEEMKADAELQNTPVIMLTSLEQESDMKKAMDAGAVDYFLKTDVNIGTLVAKVQKFLSTKN